MFKIPLQYARCLEWCNFENLYLEWKKFVFITSIWEMQHMIVLY